MAKKQKQKQKVQVNKDDLLRLVDYCWHDERHHYIEQPSDNHILVSLMPLALACGYIESEKEEWDAIREVLD